MARTPMKRLRVIVLPVLAAAGVAAFLLLGPLQRESQPSAEPAAAIVAEPETAASAPVAERASAPAPVPAPALATPDPAQALAAWRDPFQAEAAKFVALQDKIKLKEKEIEVLKLAVEEKKLRDQLRGGDRDSLRALAAAVTSTPRVAAVETSVELRAVILTPERRAALLVSGSRSAWVRDGATFEGWRVERLEAGTAHLVRGDGRRLEAKVER